MGIYGGKRRKLTGRSYSQQSTVNSQQSTDVVIKADVVIPSRRLGKILVISQDHTLTLLAGLNLGRQDRAARNIERDQDRAQILAGS